jgi:hypothetical protein
VFFGFSRIFLLGILVFKGLTARRLYKSFGVKGLIIRQFLRYFPDKCKGEVHPSADNEDPEGSRDIAVLFLYSWN